MVRWFRPTPLQACAALALALSCHSTPAETYGQLGTRAAFDLQSDTSTELGYWDLPYPSDLRLDETGAVDFRVFPNPRKQPIIDSFRVIGSQWKGFSVLAIAHFRFDAPIAQHVLDELPAGLDQGAQLVDVDPASPERGRLFPVVLNTPTPDDYAPDNMLSTAARPGVVLHPKRT